MTFFDSLGFFTKIHSMQHFYIGQISFIYTLVVNDITTTKVKTFINFILRFISY